MTEDDVRLLDALDERADGIGLPRAHRNSAERYQWVYGPNIDAGTRGRMLDWAEAHQLTYAGPVGAHRCLNWLREGACRSSRCRNHVRKPWLDHVTGWRRDGEPAVLVAQPYWLTRADGLELGALDKDPSLRLELRAEGWYGYGAWFVGIWRLSL